jgi:uncharacterized repeat protein (TIGR03803 family)
MKTSITKLFLLPVLITGLGLILAGRVMGQSFTTLHGFEWFAAYSTNSEGVFPSAGLILSSNTLFGTTEIGGSLGQGTVFAVNTNGSGFRVLHSFIDIEGTTSAGNRRAALILSGNTLYGTQRIGGSGNGTVFAINTDGSGFTNLHSFTGVSDGANPLGGLILSSNTLYGATGGGGTNGNGTVFAVNTNGTGFRNLHSFFALAGSSGYAGSGTNSDGANPWSALIISGDTLYGMAAQGGSSGNGTLFALNTDGTSFTTLHSFTALSGGLSATNADGAYFQAGLILSSNTLYGMAFAGGPSGNGTVFKVDADGTGFTTLYSFTGVGDGAHPRGGLTLSGNTLYGATVSGGSGTAQFDDVFGATIDAPSGAGTVFAVNTDGTGFTTLHSFTTESMASLANSDGAFPWGGLVLSGITLYGTAEQGGSSGAGTVFSIFLQPKFTIIPSRTNLILTWPTNYIGFAVQSTTNLASPVWTTNSLVPVVVNGQNVVTNPISGTQQFFRLSQ